MDVRFLSDGDGFRFRFPNGHISERVYKMVECVRVAKIVNRDCYASAYTLP